MKKIIAVILILVLVVLCLPSCGKKCTKCSGDGYSICPWVGGLKEYGFHTPSEDCWVCDSGRVYCEACNGTGRIK